MSKTVLLAYGSGGHNEEMIRLYEQMNKLVSQCDDSIHYISLCDDDVKHYVSDDVVVVPSVTDKFSYVKLFLKMPRVFIQTIVILYKLVWKHNIDFVITTGPGIGVVCGFFFKFTKTKVISIENSSRFYSKSLTGRAMYYLADYFIVQNAELLKLYDKAVYKGRL